MATNSEANKDNSTGKQPAELTHNIHPSLVNTVESHAVSNSPFLNQKQHHEQFHAPHPSIANMANTRMSKVQSVKAIFDDKPKQFEHDHTTSVYVLDEAKLAERGIDYWQNQRNHSRVDTQWWLNQMKMRKLLKNQTTKTGTNNSSMTSHNIAQLGTSANSTNRSVRINTNANTYRIGGYSPPGARSPSDDVEESIIEHSMIEHSFTHPEHVQTPVDIDDDLNEEYEALLEEYRFASKQLLESEKDKHDNMLVLNEQKGRINNQNTKIEELQRQLKVFEDALNETNKVNEENNQLFLEKLEKNLILNTKNELISEQITKQITEKVNVNFNKQMDVVLNDQKKKENEDYNVLLKEIEMMKQRLDAKDVMEKDLRNKLDETKDEMINLQKNELNRDKQKEMQILELEQKLKEHEFENKHLLENVEDLKHELQMQRNVKSYNNPNQDDVKENAMDEYTPLLNDREIDDDVLKEEQFKRTPRKHTKQEYIGLKAKEYFLQREWCCGLVCCNSACGCGSY